MFTFLNSIYLDIVINKIDTQTLNMIDQGNSFCTIEFLRFLTHVLAQEQDHTAGEKAIIATPQVPPVETKKESITIEITLTNKLVMTHTVHITVSKHKFFSFHDLLTKFVARENSRDRDGRACKMSYSNQTSCSRMLLLRQLSKIPIKLP